MKPDGELCVCGHALDDHEYRFSHISGMHYGECLFISGGRTCSCNLFAPMETEEDAESIFID